LGQAEWIEVQLSIAAATYLYDKSQ